MKKILLSVLVFGLVFAGAKDASACKPGPGYPQTLQQAYDSSDVVFVGTVDEVTPDRTTGVGDATLKFKIDYGYKGSFSDPQVVKVAASSAACGFDDANGTFKEGEVWIIFATDGKTEGYRTNSIVPNKKYATVLEAKAAADPLKDNTVMCTMQYDPKCGSKDGVQKTYGNACLLGADKADFVRDGECVAAPGSGTTVTGSTGTGKPVVGGTDAATVTASTTELVAELSWWQKLWQGIKNVIFFWK